MPFVKEERAANHTSYVYAVGTSLPVETQDRRQSNSAEAYMAFPFQDWRAVFPSLSAFASDWPAVLSHPALLYPRSPIGRESIKTGTKADSPDGLYCSGERILPPYAQLMGNRNAHQKGGSSADIPHK